MNSRSLSRSILLLPGPLAASADGGSDVDLIDVLAKTYGKGLPPDSQKTQSFQPTARAGWRAFSLAVQTALDFLGSKTQNRFHFVLDWRIVVQ